MLDVTTSGSQVFQDVVLLILLWCPQNEKLLCGIPLADSQQPPRRREASGLICGGRHIAHGTYPLRAYSSMTSSAAKNMSGMTVLLYGGHGSQISELSSDGLRSTSYHRRTKLHGTKLTIAPIENILYVPRFGGQV